MADLYDVNALLALFDEGHEKHYLVNEWHEGNIDRGWATCPISQNGYLRIRSQPSYPRPLNLSQAYDQLRDVIDTPHHQFIPDDISLLDDTLVQFGALTGHRLLTDVYLLALAVKHGARLVTLDTSILLETVRGATGNHLVIL